MRKTAFLFPGQGSQEVGMGKDLFASDGFFRSLIQRASDMVREDLEKICLRGPEKALIKARFLQPLITAVSLGYWRRLEEGGVTPDMVLGHSLGEITSLGAAGVVSPEQALDIATIRGELMDEMAARCNGGMMAVLFMPLDKVEALLETMNCSRGLVLANDNAPDQVVLSGDVAMLERFAGLVEPTQLGKCKRILVSGPWHSPFMNDARVRFEEWAEPIRFRKPSVPIVLNASAAPECHPSTIKHLITWQLTNPVFWRESMEALRVRGVDTLIEIGPGRVLSGLARVNGFGRATKVYNANNLRGVEQAVSELSRTDFTASAAA